MQECTSPLLLDSVAIEADKRVSGRHLYPEQGQELQGQLMKKAVRYKAAQSSASISIQDTCEEEVFISL